jgi:hypothetical protein
VTLANRSLRTDQRPEHVSSSRCQISSTQRARRIAKLYKPAPMGPDRTSAGSKPVRRSGGRVSAKEPAGETTSKKWWSQTGSNRRPQACKASALPTELWPRTRGRAASAERVVGLGGFEPPTSRLSSARSNQLSYKPVTPQPPNAARHPSRGPAGSSLEERETKTAAVPHDRPDWPCCLSVPIGFFD